MLCDKTAFTNSFFQFAYKTVMKNLRLKNRFAFSDSVFLRRIWFSQVVRFDYRDVILHFAAKKCFQRGVARVRTYRKVRREGEKSQFIDLIIRFYKKKMIVISTLVNLFGRYLKFKTNRIRKHCYFHFLVELNVLKTFIFRAGSYTSSSLLQLSRKCLITTAES
jgi:hypothetical protein